MRWSEKRAKGPDANITGSGKEWHVRVKLTLPDGSFFERKLLATSKTLAKKRRDDLYALYNEMAYQMVTQVQEQALPTKEASLTLKELAEKCRDEWWPAKGRSVDVAEQFFQKIRDYVFPVLGEGRAIEDIVPDDWDRVLAHLLSAPARAEKSLSEATIRKVKASFSSALTCAVIHKRLPFNPIKGLPYNPNPLAEADRLGKDVEDLADEDDEPSKRMLSDAEVKTLLETAKGTPIYPLVVLQLGFGLRIGEALAVRWSDFVWGDNELRIRHQVKRRRNPAWTVGSAVPKTVLQRVGMLKSRAGRRSIYIFSDALSLLNTLKRGLDSAPLSANETGGLMEPRNAQRSFKELLKNAKIQGEQPTTHSLRSWRLSNWANVMALPVSQLQRLAGHTRVETTMKYYVRSDSEHLQQWLSLRGDVPSPLADPVPHAPDQ